MANELQIAQQVKAPLETFDAPRFVQSDAREQFHYATSQLQLWQHFQLSEHAPQREQESLQLLSLTHLSLLNSPYLHCPTTIDIAAEHNATITYPAPPGQSLAALLQYLRNRQVSLPLLQTLQYARDMADALQHLQQQDIRLGALHPSYNWVSQGRLAIMISPYTLFTLSHPYTKHSQQLGYIAPELLLPNATLTEKSDIYSAAMMLYELCAGHHAFTFVACTPKQRCTTPAPSLQILRPDLPSQLIQLVDRGLRISPKQRPGLEEWRQELGEIHQAAIQAEQRQEQTRPWTQRSSSRHYEALSAIAFRAASTSTPGKYIYRSTLWLSSFAAASAAIALTPWITEYGKLPPQDAQAVPFVRPVEIEIPRAKPTAPDASTPILEFPFMGPEQLPTHRVIKTNTFRHVKKDRSSPQTMTRSQVIRSRAVTASQAAFLWKGKRCRRIREQAEQARKQMAWNLVLQATDHENCWSPQRNIERLHHRSQAFFMLGYYEDCNTLTAQALSTSTNHALNSTFNETEALDREYQQDLKRWNSDCKQWTR